MCRALITGLAFGGIAACALVGRQPERLPDGSFRIACDAPLTSCLGTFERICEPHGYDVLSASERRRRHDLRDVPAVTVTSEAQVRCKTGEPVFGTWPLPPAPAQPAAPP